MKLLTRIATHPLIALAFRLYLGGLFIYASMYKISYAAEFANSIAAYRIVPFWGVNFMAATLPWVELLLGLLLVGGLRVRVAALGIGFLLAVFTVAVAINVVRGAPASCGCFHSMEEPMTWKTVIRDLIWLAMAAHVYLYDRYLHVERMIFKRLREA